MTADELLVIRKADFDRLKNPEDYILGSLGIVAKPLIPFLSDAWDAGARREYDNHFGTVPNPCPDKETFVKEHQFDL